MSRESQPAERTVLTLLGGEWSEALDYFLIGQAKKRLKSPHEPSSSGAATSPRAARSSCRLTTLDDSIQQHF